MKHLLLLSKLNEHFGSEWVTVEEPETLHIMFERAGIPLDEISGDMVNALKTLFLSDLPWEDPFVFENIVDALNATPVIPTTITKPTVSEIMYAVYVMQSIKPHTAFSDDVESYIASVAIDAQMVILPPPLAFVNHKIPVDDAGAKVRLNSIINKLNEITTVPHEDIQLKKILMVHQSFEEKKNGQ